MNVTLELFLSSSNTLFFHLSIFMYVRVHVRAMHAQHFKFEAVASARLICHQSESALLYTRARSVARPALQYQDSLEEQLFANRLRCFTFLLSLQV